MNDADFLYACASAWASLTGDLSKLHEVNTLIQENGSFGVNSPEARAFNQWTQQLQEGIENNGGSPLTLIQTQELFSEFISAGRQAVDGNVMSPLDFLGPGVLRGGILLGSKIVSESAYAVGSKLAVSRISSNGTAVLGHFPEYTAVARLRNASCFDIGRVWNFLTPSQQWALNLKFLDEIAARGQRVVLSISRSNVRPGSILVNEINHLTTKKGYIWLDDWTLIPGVPG